MTTPDGDYQGLVDSIIKDAEAEGERVLGVPLSAGGEVVDPVGFTADPFGAIVSARVGWLLEHVSFLREPLDALLGDPDNVNANLAKLRSAAAELHELGGAFNAPAANLDATAAVTAVSGMLVARTRGIVFDLVASTVAELVRGALIAEAAAPLSHGGSIAAYAAHARTRAAATASTIAGRIAGLLAALERQAARLGELEVDRQGEAGDPGDAEHLEHPVA